MVGGAAEQAGQVEPDCVRLTWTPEARADVERLADFLAVHDPVRAAEVELELIEAPKRLPPFPRRGRALAQYRPRDVRELAVGRYLMRYEIASGDMFVLRFFHGREDRFGGA